MLHLFSIIEHQYEELHFVGPFVINIALILYLAKYSHNILV